MNPSHSEGNASNLGYYFKVSDGSPDQLLFCFSLIVSEEPVLRDQFYNGNVKTERGNVNESQVLLTLSSS